MSLGIRADVRIDAPEECPIAQIDARTGESSESISKSVDPGAPHKITEEFVLNSDIGMGNLSEIDEDVSEVFSYGSKKVFRFSRAIAQGCPCEQIERFDCPIVDVHTKDGGLFLSFHASDMNHLREVIKGLRERSWTLDVQRLLQSRGDQDEQDLVFVDRSDLTDRQMEVLQKAHRMGYFEHPRNANAGEVANSLGITTSTFTEHVAAAQSKLLKSILAD